MTKQINAFYFLFFLTFITAPQAFADPVIGRYVRVELLGENRNLHMLEVEVLDAAGNNIALHKPARQTAENSHWPASNAVDGVTTTQINSQGFGNYTHTWNYLPRGQRYQWWEVDLQDDQEIATIRIYNRADCCQERINPARILVVDGNRNLQWLGNIETTALVYEFTNITKSNPAPLPLNLLLNSSFSQHTNPGTPDYWGVNTGFLMYVPDAEKRFFASNAVSPPAEVAPTSQVVELSNPYDNPASFLYFVAYNQDEFRPAGLFTFSFYLKADSNQTFEVHKGWSTFDTEKKLITATTDWQRYYATFNWSGDSRSEDFTPVLRFPSAGVYHIAAPQLEEGTLVSPYHLAYDDEHPSPAKYMNVDDAMLSAANTPLDALRPDNKSIFEYEYYTTDDSAAFLRVTTRTSQSVDIICTSPDDPEFNWSKHNVGISGATDIKIYLRRFNANQSYDCDVLDNLNGQWLSGAAFKRLPANDQISESRINHFTGGMLLRNAGQSKPEMFYLQGMAVPYSTDAWYFQQLAQRGINTVLYTNSARNIINPNDPALNDTKDLDTLLSNAGAAGLNVVVGFGFAGPKTSKTAEQLANFYRLVEKYKSDPTVIGWYAVDEPDGATWTAADLLHVYDTIKQTDPYHIAIINWVGDPSYKIGQEPLNQAGTLASSDIYSTTDGYPFAFHNGMQRITQQTITAKRTAQLFNKGAHGWLQLWGFGSAWREPNIAELRYLAYLNVIYGSAYSYFSAKSQSDSTWENFKPIQDETKWLALNLIYKKSVNQVVPPVIDTAHAQANFIYSVTRRNSSECYVVVIHNDNPDEAFSFDPNTCFSGATQIKSKFENDRQVAVGADGLVHDGYAPYQTRVYILSK